MTNINIDTPGASGANPTATASDVAVNGSAATFLRSDGAPAVQKGSSSQFGIVEVDGVTITSAAGVISALIPGPGGSQSASYLVSGGQVVWISSFTFIVTAATYYIQGILYTSLQQTVTLTAADATDPRIDSIILDDTGTATKVTGTAASTPSEPNIDPGTQLKLAIVSVPALATQPPGVSSTLLYEDDVGSPTEWNWSTSGSGFTLNSATDPYSGTVDIDGTSVTAGSYAQGQIGSGSYDLATSLLFSFYIKSKSTWANKRGLEISFRSNGVLVGSAVPLNRTGTFGFDSTNTSTYQLVAIPVNTFNIPIGSTVNQVRFTDFGGSINFRLDLITIQGGSVTPAPGNSAPLSSSYVVIAADSTLTNERILKAGTGITLTDGGANGNITVATPGGANPTGTAGDTAVNGVLTTFMRSDGAPAIQKTSSSLFGLAKVDNTTITASGGVISAVGGAGGLGNVTGPASSTDTAIATWNGTGGTALRNNSAVLINSSGNISTTGKLDVTGNVSGGNLTTAGVVAATGNVSGGNLTTAGLISATGNISGGNLTTGGLIDATGNVSGGNLTTAGKVIATGNVTGGNLTTAGLVSATGTISGSNIGNITPTNLDGNSSHVLLGTGTFGVVPSGAGGGLSNVYSTTTTGNVSSITTSTLSGGKHLMAILSGRSLSAALTVAIALQFNGNTSALYHFQTLADNNNTVNQAQSAGDATSARFGELPGSTADANKSGTISLFIGNYLGTTFYKSWNAQTGLAFKAATGGYNADMTGGDWASTAAIANITVSCTSGFADGTTFDVYTLA